MGTWQEKTFLAKLTGKEGQEQKAQMCLPDWEWGEFTGRERGDVAC
jgi:hypothetical protein